MIRFIGKTTVPLIGNATEQKSETKSTINESIEKAITNENVINGAQLDVLVNKNGNNLHNNIDIELETNDDKIETIYQPLSLDPPPPIDHLIVQRPQQHCSNIKVYRQLLSPYLKPSAKWRAKSSLDNEEMQRKQNHNDARHLTESIEPNLVNHVDRSSHCSPNSIHMPSNASIDESLSKPIETDQNAVTSKLERNNYENRNKTADQYAIYRKILRRSNE